MSLEAEPHVETSARQSESVAHRSDADRIDWLRTWPYFALHLACLAVFWVGWSPVALWTAAALYVGRMFLITGFFHRYFSHRAFKTSRPVQFIAAALGCMCVQRNPFWWAAHHRHHHRHSDEQPDRHSPRQRGMLWAHMLWFLTKSGYDTDTRQIRDWAKFPELMLIPRIEGLLIALFAASTYAFGAALEAWAPRLGTDGLQMLVWGFVVSTVVLYHATYTINSLSHRFGSRRYATSDDSRNNAVLALITLGEGWHNNHHHYPASVRQGFYWYELDITYLILRAMSAVGLVWDLRPVCPNALVSNRIDAAPNRASAALSAGAMAAGAMAAGAVAAVAVAASDPSDVPASSDGHAPIEAKAESFR